MRQILIFVALLLLILSAISGLCVVNSACADELTIRPLAHDDLVAALGAPADPRAVRHLMRGALRDGEPAPHALAEALGHTGGCAALEALTRLLKEREAGVRIAALAGIRRIGLRCSETAHAVFRIVLRRRGAERIAAIEALGIVGDGRDVELLLACARSEDPRERRAAFAALSTMADVPIPPVYARWKWYFEVLITRVQAELIEGLEALDADPGGVGMRSRREALARHAWVDIVLVKPYLMRWLRDEDEARRANACWLVGALRISDYGRAVARCRRLARRGSALETEAERALRILGLGAEEAP